jgi:HlyD family secretion protein
MTTSTTAAQAIGQGRQFLNRRPGSRRVATGFAVLVCIAAANFYFLKGRETSRTDPNATGWTVFQLEAPPPPIYATGSVRSSRTARISPPVAGVVSRVLPDKFTQVHAGDVLIELDRRQSMATLDQETLALETAQVEEAGARQYLEYLEQQAARYKKLRDDGIIADSTYQEALSNAGKQEFQAQILLKRTQTARLAVKRDQDQIDQMSIRAPIDGIVTEVAVTPGQFVAPGGSGDQASMLLTISSLKDLTVQLMVDEIDVSRITIGQQIDLKIDALPAKTALGRVHQIARAPNPPQTGKPGVTYEVDLDLLSFPPELTVGMSVFASIADLKSPGRYLPADAVQRDSSGAWVWTIDRDKLHKQAIEVVVERDGRLRLRSGLDQSTAIIYGSTDLLRSLAEGQPAPQAK